MPWSGSAKFPLLGILMAVGFVVSLISGLPNNQALAVIRDDWAPQYCWYEPDQESDDPQGKLFCKPYDVLSYPVLLPEYLDARHELEVKRSQIKWEQMTRKYPYFECLPQGSVSNCYELDKWGEAKKNFCEVLGNTLCAGLAISLCAPSAGAAGPAIPLGVAMAAACATTAQEICKKTVVDPTCKDIGTSQRKLIATFPLEPK